MLPQEWGFIFGVYFWPGGGSADLAPQRRRHRDPTDVYEQVLNLVNLPARFLAAHRLRKSGGIVILVPQSPAHYRALDAAGQIYEYS
jgi:hypothetical protein